MAGGPGDVVDGEADLEHRVAVRLARLGVDEVGELVDAAGDHSVPAPEHVLAPVEADLGPPPGGDPRAFDGAAATSSGVAIG